MNRRYNDKFIRKLIITTISLSPVIIALITFIAMAGQMREELFNTKSDVKTIYEKQKINSEKIARLEAIAERMPTIEKDIKEILKRLK